MCVREREILPLSKKLLPTSLLVVDKGMVVVVLVTWSMAFCLWTIATGTTKGSEAKDLASAMLKSCVLELEVVRRGALQQSSS